MKFLRPLLLLVSLLGCVVATQAQVIWTGLGGNTDVATSGNWLGNVTPPNDGSANLQLGQALFHTLKLSAAYDFNSVALTASDSYSITTSGAQTLTLHNGLTLSSTVGSSLSLSSNLTVDLVAAETFDAGKGSVTVNGKIIQSMGPYGVTLLSSAASGGSFTFTNTGIGNTYTGNTTVGNGTNPLTVAFYNSSPFGTGSVSVLGGPASASAVLFSAHGTQTLTNNFSLNGFVSLRSYDAPLVLSGPVTLAGNTTLVANTTPNSLPSLGLAVRDPIVFSGNISGTSSLTANGAGLLFLTGTNTYTGGTTVGAGTTGSVVFGSASSTGTAPVLVNSQGYAGDATPGDFATFLTHINAASGGALGIDTLSGNATFNDNINLSSFTNSNIRIGSASIATLSALSTITPQGTNYQFGNGGGTLYVQSSLSGARAVSMNNSSSSLLTLYLQGTNTYSNGTTVTNGFVVFDGASALPGAGVLKASGAGSSYLGYSDLVGVTPATFLSKFDLANTNGIIGFDTNATTYGATGTTTISGPIDLSPFTNASGVFLGTSTSAILAGALTPTGDTILRLTAVQGGVLTVNGAISGATSVVIGTPSSTAAYSTGTVILNNANTYAGGTLLNAYTSGGVALAFGDNSALGTGALTVKSGNGGIAGLQAATGSLVLPNSIVLTDTGATGPRLHFTGANDFTLSGPISSNDNTSTLTLYNSTPINVTLTGNNAGFLGNINVTNGTLNLFNDNAAGLGTVYISSGAAIAFSTPAPVLYGLNGGGSVALPGGTNLTIDISDAVTHDSSYGGVISGAGNLAVISPAAPAANILNLSGNNAGYTGNISVSGNYSVLALGNNSAGTGAVSLNAPSGGLILNSGATFANPLTFTAGALGGLGTFNTGAITFGPGQSVMPGFGTFSKSTPVGTLTFNSSLTFANGGTYAWGVADGNVASGASLLNLTGSLTVTATAGGFNFTVTSFDSSGNPGFANLTSGTPYSIDVLHATGGIIGFSAADFTIDGSQFLNGTASGFSLTQSGNDLFLNFTPVPEPSTYALLGLGLGAVLFPALRRRKRV